MLSTRIITFVLVVAFGCLQVEAGLQAGVGMVDATLPVGVPLAGYNHGPRRVPYWPIPYPTNYTTWMTPSVGVLDPTWAKALVIVDSEGTEIALVAIDAIGADGELMRLAYSYAAEMGFTIPESNVIFGVSHTHSGPGAVSPSFLWELAPAVDLLVPELQRQIATSIAKSLILALKNLRPAKMNIGIAQLLGVTKNRRAGFSPYVRSDTIDPNLGIIRVDDLSGHPMATVWNFAIHGVCYGPDNMFLSGDIMGRVNYLVQQQLGGVSMFFNADAGDIDPAPQVCKTPPAFAGAPVIAAAIVNARNSLNTSDTVYVTPYSHYVDFGPTNLNATLARFANCTSGGPLDVCTICAALNCDLNEHLGSAWIENTPRFTAIRFQIGQVNTVIVSMPGEPLLELGWWVRNDTQLLGFDQTLLFGYSNNHMGYFATGNEYDVGGYESQLTFWGYYTANMVRNGVYQAAIRVL